MLGLAASGASACAGEAVRRSRGLEADPFFDVPLAMLADLAEGLSFPDLGPLVLDRESCAAHVGGVALRLARKEFELLVMLASADRLFTVEELQTDVWGYPASLRTGTVKQHACRLRAELAKAGLVGWVVNVWGMGYRLLPDEMP